jgi:hypothetical protein
MSYFQLGAAIMPQQLGVFDPMALATAGAPPTRPTPLPAGTDPATVEWLVKPDGTGMWVCKATGYAMSRSGRCLVAVVHTESPTTLLKKECTSAGHPWQVCTKIKAGDTMREVQKYAEAWARRTTGEKRQEYVAAECRAAGVPYELVGQCVQQRMANVAMEDIIKGFEKLSDEELAALGVGQHAAAQMAALAEQQRQARTRKYLIYGGLAAGGAVVLALVSRKRKKSS